MQFVPTTLGTIPNLPPPSLTRPLKIADSVTFELKVCVATDLSVTVPSEHGQIYHSRSPGPDLNLSPQLSVSQLPKAGNCIYILVYTVQVILNNGEMLPIVFLPLRPFLLIMTFQYQWSLHCKIQHHCASQNPPFTKLSQGRSATLSLYYTCINIYNQIFVTCYFFYIQRTSLVRLPSGEYLTPMSPREMSPPPPQNPYGVRNKVITGHSLQRRLHVAECSYTNSHFF